LQPDWVLDPEDAEARGLQEIEQVLVLGAALLERGLVERRDMHGSESRVSVAARSDSRKLNTPALASSGLVSRE
jgi:hypothetical protein